MKFFIENQKVEKEIEWVLNQVRLHMNGATSSQMEERGVNYRQNYGVAIPHLKQLAERIPVSYDLAERLWFMEIRETMLLAALMVPQEEMSLQRCKEWSDKVDNIDLIERSAMFLWGRLSIAAECASVWLKEQSGNKKALAFYTIGRKLQMKEPVAGFDIANVIGFVSSDDDLPVLKAVSFLLRMLIRNGQNENSLLMPFINNLLAAAETAKQLLGEELKTELDFMKEK